VVKGEIVAPGFRRWSGRDAGWSDRVLLVGRIVRALRELAGTGIAVDLSGCPVDQGGDGPWACLAFRGRIPGATVAAAALSAVTGWRPASGRGAGTVDLLDDARRPRLRIHADRDVLRIEIHDADAHEAPGTGVAIMPLVRDQARHIERRCRSSASDVFRWLEELQARCDEAVAREGIEVLRLSREGRRPLRLALHTVAEARRQRDW